MERNSIVRNYFFACMPELMERDRTRIIFCRFKEIKTKFNRMDKKFSFDHVLILGEKIIYALIVLFLFVGAFLLVYDEVLTIFHYSGEADGIKIIIEIISKTLLLLMIIEILVTVRISIREHTVCAEPFFVIGLIASVRRILIISVETAYIQDFFYQYMIEIGVLVGLSLAFVVSIVLLRKSKVK